MTETLSGQIDRITYHNVEDGFTIARMVVEGIGGSITLVGNMASAREGESLSVTGQWTNHPRYGRQFQLESYVPTYPTTKEGITKFLSSGLIKGVGPVSAQRIVDHFGVDTMEVIDSDPDRLLEVPKLGKSRVAVISQAWGEQRQVKDVMVFLQSHGVTTGYAIKIFKHYGADAIRTVSENPYRLERDIRGIGFQTADAIARNLGTRLDAPERIAAGVRYLLDQASSNGHVYLPEDKVYEDGKALLGVGKDCLAVGLANLQSGDLIVSEKERNYLPPLYQAEVGVVHSLIRLVRTPSAIDLIQTALDEQLQLAPGQRRAIDLAVDNKVLIVTGGPGTGKTTITRAILRLFERHGLHVSLCSPTGRAAKRLSEATEREAKTIHRLLEFAPGEGVFRKGVDDRLAADAIIVDEASMIDVILMNALLRAIGERSRLVLVGDVDQLPSVGPGNILRDIIDSGQVPVVRLTEIFRQERGSQIVASAHLINRGHSPRIDNVEATDFFFIEESDPERTVGVIEDLCFRRLPAHGGWDPIREIQVITPMYRGPAGANNLNEHLQRYLNPTGERLERPGGQYRVGDKVMQVRNNYDKGVFNGDMGVIIGLDVEKKSIQVAFETAIGYESEELDELMLAYAISTHRAQGTEFPAVVIPLTTQHYVMLQRNLLYTAVTRAKEFIVIVGTQRALKIAVANDAVGQRFTSLRQRLSDAAAQP